MFLYWSGFSPPFSLQRAVHVHQHQTCSQTTNTWKTPRTLLFVFADEFQPAGFVLVFPQITTGLNQGEPINTHFWEHKVWCRNVFSRVWSWEILLILSSWPWCANPSLEVGIHSWCCLVKFGIPDSWQSNWEVNQTHPVVFGRLKTGLWTAQLLNPEMIFTDHLNHDGKQKLHSKLHNVRIVMSAALGMFVFESAGWD